MCSLDKLQRTVIIRYTQRCPLLPLHRQQQRSRSPHCHLLAGDTAGPRAARGPTGVQPLPNGKYTRAELASFEDSDAPPSLHSSEEPVTRMYYSDMDFATAKPANRGTASGAEPKTCSIWQPCRNAALHGLLVPLAIFLEAVGQSAMPSWTRGIEITRRCHAYLVNCLYTSRSDYESNVAMRSRACPAHTPVC